MEGLYPIKSFPATVRWTNPEIVSTSLQQGLIPAEVKTWRFTGICAQHVSTAQSASRTNKMYSVHTEYTINPVTIFMPH